MKLLHLTPFRPLNTCSVHLPGSKSYTNRALVLAALASGQTTLHLASLSQDSHVLLKGLNQLGVESNIEGTTVQIEGVGGRFKPFTGSIDIGPAGTSMRFLTSVAAIHPQGHTVLCGTERMHQRPIGALVDAWRTLGCSIEYLEAPGCPPIRIQGQSVETLQKEVSLPGDVSSQFLTSLLLVAPLFPKGLTIHIEGDLVSKSYIDMTLSVLEAFGIDVIHKDHQHYTIAPLQSLQSRTYTVEGDASGGSYFWGLAAVTGSTIRVYNASKSSCQGDIRFPELLKQMGCLVVDGHEQGVDWIEVTGAPQLHGLHVDMESMPDTALTLAVVAACAKGKTHITGLQTLRHKETDRLLALQTELKKVGIHSESTESTLTIWGDPDSLRGAQICTYEDHRIAMAFSLVGALCDGICIEEPDVVGKSFPTYWELWQQLGGQVKYT